MRTCHHKSLGGNGRTLPRAKRPVTMTRAQSPAIEIEVKVKVEVKVEVEERGFIG